jgi:hypothetical protein
MGEIVMPLRIVSLGLLLASLVASAPAFSGDKHMLLGTWSVDVSKMQQPDPPKSVTLVLAESGEGSYKMSVDIVRSDGAKSHAEGTFKSDGTASPAVGSPDLDIASMTMPSKRILVMAAGYSGKPSSSRVWSLADDDKHMIETVLRHLPDGTPYTRTFTWIRQ